MIKGEVRSIIVAFDDEDTGLEQIQKYKHDEQLRYENGVPIFRQNQAYDAPFRKSFVKTHGAKCQIKQFPLKLAWASTGHKVQGITIKSPNKVVVHGHKKIPNGMYYLMLSRMEKLEQVYIEMPKIKPDRSERIEFVIRANSRSLEENAKLVERSIIPYYKEKKHSIFMLNIASVKNKLLDLEKDIQAQVSDHICVVETWLDNNSDCSLTGRYVCRGLHN